MAKHHLKTYESNFNPMLTGVRCDLRREELNIEVGDEVTFAEWIPNRNAQAIIPGVFSGHKIHAIVTHIKDSRCQGIMPGHVVISFIVKEKVLPPR